jgi:Cu-processing system permease protein
VTNVLLVAADIVREAASRRWIVGIWAFITLLAVVLALALEMRIVDGVLASTRLFGSVVQHDLRSADLALLPVFEVGTWLIFVGGVLFGILSCCDFAPELLMPGRVEQLLALPLRRSELILGTYAGVLSIAVLGSVYGSGIFTLLLGTKSGTWSPALLVSGFAGCAVFSALYGAMLASATFVRSASLSAAVGAGLFAGASVLTQPSSAAAMDAGIGREVFLLLTAWLPRFTLLRHLGLAAAGIEPFTLPMARATVACAVFGIACVALAIWKSERTDY